MALRSSGRGKGEIHQLMFEESNTDEDSYAGSHQPSRRASQPKVESYTGRPNLSPSPTYSDSASYAKDAFDSAHNSKDRRGSASHDAAAGLVEISEEHPPRASSAVVASKAGQDRTYGYVPDTEPLSEGNLSVQRKNKIKQKSSQRSQEGNGNSSVNSKPKGPQAPKIPSPPSNSMNAKKKSLSSTKSRDASIHVSTLSDAYIMEAMEAPREFEPLPTPKKKKVKKSSSASKSPKDSQRLTDSKIMVDMSTNTYPSHLSPDATEDESSYSRDDSVNHSTASSPSKKVKKVKAMPRSAASSKDQSTLNKEPSSSKAKPASRGQSTGTDYDRRRPMIVVRKGPARGTKGTYASYSPRKLVGGDPSNADRHGTASENLRKRLAYDAPTASGTSEQQSTATSTKRNQNYYLYGGEEAVEMTPEGKYYVKKSISQPYKYAPPSHGASLGQIQRNQFPSVVKQPTSSSATNSPQDEGALTVIPATSQLQIVSTNTALRADERVAAKKLELAERSKEVLARREAKRQDVERQAELLESERRYWGTKYAFERQQRIIEKKIYLRELTALWAERTDRSPYWLDELEAMGMKDEPKRRRIIIKKRIKKRSKAVNEEGETLNADEDPADDAERQLIAKYMGRKSLHPLDNYSYDGNGGDDGTGSATESEKMYLESMAVLDGDGDEGLTSTERHRLIAKLKRKKNKKGKGPRVFTVEEGASYPDGEEYTQVMVDDDGTTRTVTMIRKARQEVSIQTDEIRLGDSDWFYLYEGTSSDEDSDDYEYEVEYSLDDGDDHTLPNPQYTEGGRPRASNSRGPYAPSSPLDRARIRLVSAGGTRYDHNGRPQPRDDMEAEQRRARELNEEELAQNTTADPQSARRGRQSPNAMYVGKDKFQVPPTVKDGSKEYHQAVAIFSKRVQNPHRYREGIVIRYEPRYRGARRSNANASIAHKPPADTMASPHRPRMGKAFLVAHHKKLAELEGEAEGDVNRLGIPMDDDVSEGEAYREVANGAIRPVVVSPKKPLSTSVAKHKGSTQNARGVPEANNGKKKAEVKASPPTERVAVDPIASVAGASLTLKGSPLKAEATSSPLEAKPPTEPKTSVVVRKESVSLPPLTAATVAAPPSPSPVPSESPKTPTSLPSIRKPPAPPPVNTQRGPTPPATLPSPTVISSNATGSNITGGGGGGGNSPPQVSSRVPMPPTAPPPQSLARGVEARRKSAAEGAIIASSTSTTATNSANSSRPPSSTPKNHSLVGSRHQSVVNYPTTGLHADGSVTTTGLDNPSAFTAGQLARQLSVEREMIQASERRTSLREENARQRRVSERAAAIEEFEQLMAQREKDRTQQQQQARQPAEAEAPQQPAAVAAAPIQPAPSSAYDNSRLPSRSGLKSRERGSSPTNRVQFNGPVTGGSVKEPTVAFGETSGNQPLFVNSSFVTGGSDAGGLDEPIANKRMSSANSSNASSTLPPFPISGPKPLYNDYSAPIFVPEALPTAPIVALDQDLSYEQKVAAELARLREEARLEALRMEEDDGL